MLPLLLTAIPALVGLAEKLIKPGTPAAATMPGVPVGDVKREFVMGVVESIYDKFAPSFMPDVPHFDEKAWLLGCARVTIEEAVKAMKQAAG